MKKTNQKSEKFFKNSDSNSHSMNFLEKQRATTRFLSRNIDHDDDETDNRISKMEQDQSLKMSKEVSKTQLKINLLLQLVAGLLILGCWGLPWSLNSRTYVA